MVLNELETCRIGIADLWLSSFAHSDSYNLCKDIYVLRVGRESCAFSLQNMSHQILHFPMYCKKSKSSSCGQIPVPLHHLGG